jgi:DNA repair protein RecO (recombination protein O)
MRKWHDEAIILTTLNHGETSAVVHLLTRENGRNAGYLRGGQSAKTRPMVQSGNLVSANWQARLPDQLGYLTLEPVQSLAAALMQKPDLSLILQSVCQMILFALPERQSYPAIFDGTKALLQTLMTSPNRIESYIWWEVHLLGALGFGLRFESCVQTGQRHDLTHISPRSGHAVCRTEAAPYADKMLRLPEFMGGADALGEQEIATGLGLTGYFLNQHIALPQGKSLPEARQRLAAASVQSPQMKEIRYG